MIERHIPTHLRCPAGCVAGWVSGTHTANPIDALHRPCPVCKGTGKIKQPKSARKAVRP